jgi:hypothetical protein
MKSAVPGVRRSIFRSRLPDWLMEAALKDAADKLLANTVIENYRVEIG